MSPLTMASPVAPRRRFRLNLAAVLGLVLSLAWFVGVRLRLSDEARAARMAQVERGAQLVTLLRHTAQDRVRTGAQVLAQDTRLQALAGLPEVDKATADDLLEDLQKLDSQELFAFLSAEGRVIAVRGAAQFVGVDLSSSQAVKAALSQDTAVTGVWLVNDRVVELAVSSIRVGERRAGLLVVGVRVEDAALATAAAASGVRLALFVEGKPAWTSAVLPAASWRSEPSSTVEVSDAARYVVVPSDAPDETLELFAWAVPLCSILFATLAFRRGGP